MPLGRSTVSVVRELHAAGSPDHGLAAPAGNGAVGAEAARREAGVPVSAPTSRRGCRRCATRRRRGHRLGLCPGVHPHRAARKPASDRCGGSEEAERGQEPLAPEVVRAVLLEGELDAPVREAPRRDADRHLGELGNVEALAPREAVTAVGTLIDTDRQRCTHQPTAGGCVGWEKPARRAQSIAPLPACRGRRDRRFVATRTPCARGARCSSCRPCPALPRSTRELPRS